MKKAVSLLLALFMVFFSSVSVLAEEVTVSEEQVVVPASGEVGVTQSETMQAEEVTQEDGVVQEQSVVQSTQQIEEENASVEDDSLETGEDTESIEDLPVVKDLTKDLVKGGFLVEVFYTTDSGTVPEYIPTFVLALKDAKGKVLSVVEAGKQNYNVEKHSYEILFNLEGYKVGEQYQVMLVKADPVIESVMFHRSYFEGEDLVREEVSLKENNYFVLPISTIEYYNETETGKIIDVFPSKLFPLQGILNTKPKVAFYVVNENGDPLVDAKLKVHPEGGQSFELKTNDKGLAITDASKIPDVVLVQVEGAVNAETGKSVTVLERPFGVHADNQKGLVTLVVRVKSPNASVGGVEVSGTVNGNSDLSKNWFTLTLSLTDKNGNERSFNFNSLNGEIPGLQDGTYRVKASSDYAVVKLDSNQVTVKDGKGKISYTISPKYTLEVSKGGKKYNFSVLNVEEIASKEYKGTSPTVFGVVPGESYMIKDNDTGEVVTVAIDAKTYATKIHLGAGVFFGASGVSAPHTGDAVVYLLILIGVFSLLTVLSYVMYRKERKKLNIGATVTSIFLVLALVAQILPVDFGVGRAYAATDFGNIGSGAIMHPGKSKTTPVGDIQTSPTVSVLQIGFIPSFDASTAQSPVLHEKSTLSEMEDAFKFSDIYDGYMFYVATNKTNHDHFVSSNSGLLKFDYKVGALYTISGKNPFIKNSPIKTAFDREKRTLPYGTTGLNSENAFERFVAEVIKSIGGNDSTRQLWAGQNSSSEKNIGDSFNEQYIVELIATIAGLFNAYQTIELDILYPVVRKVLDVNPGVDRVFRGYIEKLYSLGWAREAMDLLDRYERDGKVVLFVQVVPAFYVKGNQSSMGFLPYHEAAEWYLYARKHENATLFGDIKPEHEAKITYAYSPDGKTLDKGGPENSVWRKYAPTRTFVGNMRPGLAAAVKPKSEHVKIWDNPNTRDAVNANPFLGWGYMVWPTVLGNMEKYPKIWAELDVTVKNDSGAVVDHFKVPVEGWKKEDGVYIADVMWDEPFIEGSMAVVSPDGKLYNLKSGEATVIVRDAKDVEDILIKNPLKVGVKGKEVKIPIPSDSVRNTWAVWFGSDGVPSLDKLNYYLGGSGSSSALALDDVEQKYFLPGEYSNAEVIIKVEAEESPTFVNTSGYTVPEWRLSKYWTSISERIAQAAFWLNIPAGSGYNRTLSPSGDIYFNLLKPNVPNWMMSEPKLFGDSQYKYIALNSPSATFRLGGDLLAIKDNQIVSNIKLANWLGVNSILNGKIGSTAKGSGGGQVLVTEKATVSYNVKSSVSPFIYYETRDRYNAKGEYIGSETYSTTVPENYSPARYDVEVKFQRYLPKNTSAKTFSNASESVNGKYWETIQEKDTLKVNPEVLMAYDDKNGNTSVAFVAGDKLRDIKPVTYNVARFVNVKVDPTVTGMSTATDQAAKDLAKNIANGREVIYKGSSLTASYNVDGKLELKTYALDIGNSALKNAWNPGTTYSTDKIRDAFLDRFADKDQDGKWVVTLDAEGKMIIGKGSSGMEYKEYGGQTAKLQAPQVDQKVTTYVLEVRGGKLVGVNGNRNLNALDDDLKEALTRMKILGSDNIFAAFERQAGADLNEQVVANLGNAVRGTNDLAVGKGWYNEDTTVLVVREYTTVFDLPEFMYTDKIPMDLGTGLAAPIDKNEFFSKGAEGHLKMTYKVNEAFLTADTSKGELGVERKVQYIVPNVSVMDTFTTQ